MNTKEKNRNFLKIERKVVYGVMFCFLISSQFLIPKNDWQEIFPFFHWSLFSSLDGQFNFVQIKLKTKTANGLFVECYLQDCEGAAVRLRTKNFFFLIQDLARAIKNKSSDSTAVQERINQLQQYLKKIDFYGDYDLIESSLMTDSFASAEKITENNIIYSGHVK